MIEIPVLANPIYPSWWCNLLTYNSVESAKPHLMKDYGATIRWDGDIHIMVFPDEQSWTMFILRWS